MFWRSPIRGPWLTAFLGTLLIPAITVIALTGFIDHWAHFPQLGNDTVGPAGDIPVLFHFPAWWPSWSYAVTQGTHVTLGVMVLPLVLAKLWSVMPKLFQRPAVRSIARALERISLLGLVASVLVEFATGILMMEDWVPGNFDYITVHYYGAWVFGTLFVLHTCIKLPAVRRAYRERGVLNPLMQGLDQTKPEPPDDGGLAPDQPGRSHDQPPWPARDGGRRVVDHFRRPSRRVDRRTVPAVRVAGAAWPRVRNRPQRFPDHPYRGAGRGHLGNDERRLAPHCRRCTHRLLHPRAATCDATVDANAHDHLHRRLVHDPALDRRPPRRSGPAGGRSRWRHPAASLARGGLASPALSPSLYGDPRSLLALRVNGVDISLDHGYPARVIMPNVPGGMNTKWVSELRFEAA